MEPNKVSIASDLTSGPGVHVMYGFPDFFEQAAPMGWAPGGAMGCHSLASRVWHKDSPVVLDGHDLGPLLGHHPVSFFMHNLKSSRKTMYSASTVLVEKKPVACADCTMGTPMMVCGDPIALPYGWNDGNVVHSVMVGMKYLDYLKGDVAVAVSIAVDAAAFLLSAVEGGPSAEDFAKLTKGSAAGDGLKDVTGLDPKKAGLNLVGNAVGSAVVSAATGWQEPISFKLETGGGYGGVSVEYAWTPAQEAHQVKGAVKVVGTKGEVETNFAKTTAKGSHWASDKPAEKTWGEAL